MKLSLHVLLLLSGTTIASAGFAQNPTVAPAPGPGTLLQTDFENGIGWSQTPTRGVGTIDVTDSLLPSLGLQSNTALSSGLMKVQNSETDPRKLTLAFSLSASAARPVTVRVESFGKNKKRTGGLETLVYPAAPDFYQRFALDLSSFKTSGRGKFDPTDPYVQFTFNLEGGKAAHQLRLDNVHYARPAFYVSEQGSDDSDGLTEKTAFASPQKAVDAAQPGDVILLMDGTYSPVTSNPTKEAVVSFKRGGTPSAWITLKNYPGQKPVITATGWQGVRIIQRGGPSLSYIEVRGLRVRGDGDKAKELYPEQLGKFGPRTNSQGIYVNGLSTKKTHHIRLADNIVEYAASDGIFIDYTDWFAVENSQIRNNCWASIGFAPAGIAVMHYADFDGPVNSIKSLISGNHVSGNRRFVAGADGKNKIFNGNGILLDANAEKPPAAYRGRTLVSNNLVFNNGGGGVQMWGSHRLDIVNNTLYFNGASPELKWGQLTVERCKDVRILNNLIVSQPDRSLDTWFNRRTDSGTANIVRANNLYFGGSRPPVAGVNDHIADPLFVNASIDAETADFRLKPGSPALGRGSNEPLPTLLDLNGKARGAKPTIGAYEN